ncbi:MAG: acetylxylan esterase [Chthoniobacteraceae bacterium]
MNKLVKLTLLTTALLRCAPVMAGVISLNWATVKEPVSYSPGEPITFRLQLMEDGKPVAGKTLKWVRQGDDKKTETGQQQSAADAPLEVVTSLATPGFVHLAVTVVNSDGTPLKGKFVNNKESGSGYRLDESSTSPVKFEGGVGVEPGKLTGDPDTADSDAFWNAQKARLAAAPMKVELKEIESPNPGYAAFDVQISCVGGKAVSGCLAVPKNAKEKSLPAVVSFNGYGVSPAHPQPVTGMISLNINAHGIENGRDPEFYRALGLGELKGYAFSNPENEKPETCYFNGMALRVLRALEYIKSRPEWNGKTLLVRGGSQGGLQALWAAALDGDVTECSADMPWCCDLSGIQSGRLRGWRPDAAAGLAYYDPIHLARRIKCKVWLGAGLGDSVCPASGIAVLYNTLTAPKVIDYIQGASHVRATAEMQRQRLRSE